uniref:Uncharacterized protein n=1 Tax=Arundo donax TaxID=35708 RepID=A0A0A8ZH34_ARUDO
MISWYNCDVLVVLLLPCSAAAAAADLSSSRRAPKSCWSSWTSFICSMSSCTSFT